MTLHTVASGPGTPLPGYRETSFRSGDADCAAWHFAAENDALRGPKGRPAVVMAHGFGGTKDSGLAPFAAGCAAAGLDVLAFDYRGFGDSGGQSRQRVLPRAQIDDYAAALRAAAELSGVDPNRLVLWGVSLSGGHVFAAGAGRPDVAAIVSLTPLVDGMAAARHVVRHSSPPAMLSGTALGVRGLLAAARGTEPVLMPVVGRPGTPAAMTLSGQFEAYHQLAGPTWRNEVDARVVFALSGYRPAKRAKDIRCPLLVQIADFDRSAPPGAAALAAFAGRAEVRHYPCDHFDVWPGNPWFDAALAHQISFLTRHLAVS